MDKIYHQQINFSDEITIILEDRSEVLLIDYLNMMNARIEALECIIGVCKGEAEEVKGGTEK